MKYHGPTPKLREVLRDILANGQSTIMDRILSEKKLVGVSGPISPGS